MRALKKICIVPHPRGVGGPASFRQRFSQALAARGISVTADLDDPAIDAVLVISGWRQLGKLWRLKRRGVPIVQRLDGINWMHRMTRFKLRYYLKAEYGNILMSYTRKRLADHIIYQSEFVVRRWEQVYGAVPVPYTVIYNGVDLNEFSPDGPGEPPADRTRIMLVEGSFGGGHDVGLKLALDLAHELERDYQYAVELMVAGKAPDDVRNFWDGYAKVPITWKGVVGREEIPVLDRSAHVYFSAELNAPCPNSVIEALACGLPVAAYATGSLPELVGGDAGRVVPFEGDPWKLELPQTSRLAEAVSEILQNQPRFRAGARARAQAEFDIQKLVDRYLEVLASV
jgi:glycosyltransferase involved in cell wall biosynthesis